MKTYFLFQLYNDGVMIFIWRLRMSFIKSPPLFSERNGYTKPPLRIGDWRLLCFIAKHL
jgi:hypothetical protein